MVVHKAQLIPRCIASLLLAIFLSAPLATLFAVSAQAAPVRGVAGDNWADIVIGKPNFAEVVAFTVVPNRLNIPHGVIIDRNDPSDNKMYVYDSGNNRILGFDLEDCRARGTNPLDCSAEIVIGEPNMNTSACNGDSGFQNYPQRAPGSASSLCTLPEHQLSVTEGGSGSSMVVDTEGNLYVTDFYNHRVLKYSDPFNTDTVADEVWGQADFVGNECNRGGSAGANTFCFSWGNSNNWTAGVDVDSAGNLWVVDSGNNRVLRFPNSGGSISKTADMVLGQPDFTTTSPGSSLNKLQDPNAVRVNAAGEVYVADNYNDRVLRYTTPTTGASGQTFGSGFNAPGGLDWDPTEPGRIWITNTEHALIELWDEDTNTQVRTIGRYDDPNYLGDTTGSIGVDSEGNLYPATRGGMYAHTVQVYDKGESATEPTNFIVQYSGHGNLVNNQRMAAGKGVVITDDQLIVADEGRVLFWNTPNGIDDLYDGKLPDGVINAPSFYQLNGSCCENLQVDDLGHLYLTTTDAAWDDPISIKIFNLPLTTGATATKVLTWPFDLLGGGEVAASPDNPIFGGMYVAPDASYLWVSEPNGNRVLRVRDPLGTPEVDAILGQTNSTGVECNQGGVETVSTLCHPGSLAVDRQGNFYISDHWLEIHGNMRLLRYDAGTFPTDNSDVIYATPVDEVKNDIATWEPAFDAQNVMTVGYNPYWTGVPPGFDLPLRYFPGVYFDPLTSNAVPDEQLNDYYSMGYAATFDKRSNLLMSDLNRGRILIYFDPFESDIPLLSEVTPVPTPSSDTTPTYTFNSTEAGLISYGGACSSPTTLAVSGNNTITFYPLVPGTYSDCTITVTDSVGNTSNVLSVTTFVITSPSPTPAPNPSSSGGGGGSSGAAEPQVCQASVPVGTPQLFQISRSGSSATLYFTPVKDNTANYHVMYGFQQGNPLFGALSEPVTDAQLGVKSIIISQLDPRSSYWFTVAPVNNCAVGNWSNWLKTGPVRGRLSISHLYQQLLGIFPK